MFPVLSRAWAESTGKQSFTSAASGEQGPGIACPPVLALSECPTPDFGAWRGLSGQVTADVGTCHFVIMVYLLKLVMQSNLKSLFFIVFLLSCHLINLCWAQ